MKGRVTKRGLDKLVRECAAVIGKNRAHKQNHMIVLPPWARSPRACSFPTTTPEAPTGHGKFPPLPPVAVLTLRPRSYEGDLRAKATAAWLRKTAKDILKNHAQFSEGGMKYRLLWT